LKKYKASEENGLYMANNVAHENSM